MPFGDPLLQKSPQVDCDTLGDEDCDQEDDKSDNKVKNRDAPVENLVKNHNPSSITNFGVAIESFLIV